MKKILTAVFLSVAALLLSMGAVYADEIIAVIDSDDAITTDDGVILMKASLSVSMGDDEFYWNILSGKQCASISDDGVLTAVENGEVTVCATYKDDTSISAVKTITISNQTPNFPRAIMSVSTTGANIYRDLGKSTQSNWYSSKQSTVNVGNSYDLTAVDKQSRKFLYWLDSINNRIVTDKEEYDFTLGSQTRLVAYFDNSTESKKLVEFRNTNNIILLSKYIGEGETVTVPQDPTMLGGKFAGWKNSGKLTEYKSGDKIAFADFESPLILTASYDYSETTVTVTAYGGSGSGVYTYGDLVKVEKEADNELSERSFAFWMRDGRIASTKDTYNFLAYDNCTIEAVKLDVATNKDDITIFMHNPDAESENIIFNCERTVPESVGVYESGMIISSFSNPKLDTEGAIIKKSYDRRENVQFVCKKAQMKAGTYYARGYIVYRTGTDVHVIYTNTVSITVG